MKSFCAKIHVLSRLSSIEFLYKGNTEKPKVEKRKATFSCLPLLLHKKTGFFWQLYKYNKKK